MNDPASLSEAIAMQPGWLRAWVMVLVATNLAALLFVVHRRGGKWHVRWPALAILAAFFAAGMFMEWLFQRYGYVRLLGLPHLVFWGPVWLWLLLRRRELAPAGSWWGRYVLLYLVIAGISLAVDAVDVARYLAGGA